MSEEHPKQELSESMGLLATQVNDLAQRVELIESKLGLAKPEPTTIGVCDPLSKALPRRLLDRATRPADEPVRVNTTKRPVPPPPVVDKPTTISGAKITAEWERIVGGKWALWVGSVAVFIAAAFFLAYAWKYLGDGGRLTVGFLAAIAFLVAGEMSRSRSQRWFSDGLLGAGLGLLYLNIWAGTQQYAIFSFHVGFVLMSLSTALGVILALRYDAVGLTALATIGGFLTPVLLQSNDGGTSQAVSFLTYIAVLNAGILAVSLFKRWRGMHFYMIICF